LASFTSSSVSPPASWVDSVTSTVLVDVVPLRVVVQLFGMERHARHEAEGLHEVGEGEGLADRVAALRHLPARHEKGLQKLRPLRLGQFLGHHSSVVFLKGP
jgi:hypothetical protein